MTVVSVLLTVAAVLMVVFGASFALTAMGKKESVPRRDAVLRTATMIVAAIVFALAITDFVSR